MYIYICRDQCNLDGDACTFYMLSSAYAGGLCKSGVKSHVLVSIGPETFGYLDQTNPYTSSVFRTYFKMSVPDNQILLAAYQQPSLLADMSCEPCEGGFFKNYIYIYIYMYMYMYVYIYRVSL